MTYCRGRLVTQGSNRSNALSAELSAVADSQPSPSCPADAQASVASQEITPEQAEVAPPGVDRGSPGGAPPSTASVSPSSVVVEQVDEGEPSPEVDMGSPGRTPPLKPYCQRPLLFRTVNLRDPDCL